MSYHIIHLLQPNTYVHAERGFLVCKYDNDTENRVALSDVRAVVVASKGVCFSNTVVARLLDQDAIILHCNEKYQPVGCTMPLFRVIKKDALHHQLAAQSEVKHRLWQAILTQKVTHQREVLEKMGCQASLEIMNQTPPDEANIAKYYWGHYFDGLGYATLTRQYPHASDAPNGALNYGYAVVRSLVHRSLLIHGLLPDIGIHHKERYRNTPLVHDVMEPLRGFVDVWLYDYCRTHSIESFKEWVAFLANFLRTCRIKVSSSYSLKLMDAIDRYASSIAKSFQKKNIDSLWIPTLGPADEA